MSASSLNIQNDISLILSRSPSTTPGRPAKRQRWTGSEDTKVSFSSYSIVPELVNDFFFLNFIALRKYTPSK